MDIAVRARGVEKTFVTGLFKKKRTHALRGLNIDIPRRTIFGLLGPNGAGKTTFLAILSTLVQPDRGTVSVLGMDVGTHASEIRRRINLSSGHANFLWSLTVQENLQFYGMLYGLTGKRLHQKIEELIELLNLGNYRSVRFEACSTGTKQRLALAKSLLNDPEVLLLDEPTVGLDPDVSRRIRTAVKSLHHVKGTTILLTTHNMFEAEELCQELALIRDGTICARGTPSEIKATMHLGDTVRIRLLNAIVSPHLSDITGVWECSMVDTTLIVRLDDHRKRLQQILHRLATQGYLIEDVSIEETRLEDVLVMLAQ